MKNVFFTNSHGLRKFAVGKTTKQITKQKVEKPNRRRTKMSLNIEDSSTKLGNRVLN